MAFAKPKKAISSKASGKLAPPKGTSMALAITNDCASINKIHRVITIPNTADAVKAAC